MTKVDVTQGGNLLNESLLREYRVKSVPTVVFLDAQGEEHVDVHIVDFTPPDQFLVHLARLKGSEP